VTKEPTKIKDIRSLLMPDFRVQTCTEAYLIPGTIPVRTMLPVEDWSRQTGERVEEVMALIEAGKEEEIGPDMTKEMVEMAMKGWELVIGLVKIKKPDVTQEEIEAALPTLEAINKFFELVFEEYAPSGDNPLAPQSAKEEISSKKATSPGINSKKKKQAQKK
jgi:hypothetical protein